MQLKCFSILLSERVINHRLLFVTGEGKTNEEPAKIYIRGM